MKSPFLSVFARNEPLAGNLWKLNIEEEKKRRKRRKKGMSITLEWYHHKVEMNIFYHTVGLVAFQHVLTTREQ